MTFLSGFAEGFINERNRRLEREAQIEDTQFRYGMDALVKQREKRDEKKLKEKDWAKKAQDLAAQAGDPDFASVAYNEMANGVDYTELQKRQAAGHYKKNDKFVAPTTKVRVPLGVEPGVDQYETYDDGMNLDPKVAERIDKIDPSLRKAKLDRSDFSTTDIEGNKDKYVYKPTDELEMGSLPELIYGVKTAMASGDPAQIKIAQDKLQAHKDAVVFEETEKAKAEKRAPSLVGIVDNKGVLVDTVVAQPGVDADGNEVLYDMTDPLEPTIMELPDGYKRVGISEELNKTRYKVAAKFQERKTKLDESQNNLVEAIEATGQIKEILHRNPAVVTEVASAAGIVEKLQGNVQAVYQLVASEQAEVEEALAGGDPAAIQAAMSDYEKAFVKLGQEYAGKSWLSQGNQQLAIDQAMFQSLQKKLVYSLAAANGVRGTGQSKSDLANFEKMLGVGKSPESINAVMDQMNSLVISKQRSEEDSINKDEELQAFEMELKAKSNMRPRRMGDILQSIPGRGPILRKYYDELYSGVVKGTQNAVTGGSPEPNQNAVAAPAGAIDLLKKNPQLRDQFDQKYGPGAAAQILGE